MKTAALCVLLGFLPALDQEATAQNGGVFVATGDMTTARSEHTATLLADGKVLITGGTGNRQAGLSSAELYDPSSGTFMPTSAMTTAHRRHTATRLPDGRVLIAGGSVGVSAELYDPETGTFTPTGNMLEAQDGHTATLLGNGEVLIAGGELAQPPYPTAAKAELYDPATGTFRFAATYADAKTSYSGGPSWAAATQLPDGKVLIVANNPAEIYDPEMNAFTLTGGMAAPRYRDDLWFYWHAIISLNDGSVLITGGNDEWDCPGIANADVYSPASATFIGAGSMIEPRMAHTATLLADGTVLVTGGGAGGCVSNNMDSSEIYDPATRSFIAAGRMTTRRSFHTATRLNDGRVLICGGDSYWPFTITRTAELYIPNSSPPARRRVIRH